MYSVEELQQIATNVRRGILEQVYTAKSGHPGGALSCADILTAIYFNLANIDPNEPEKEDRDRIILSKGHASAALYSVLAHRGFFDVEELRTFRKLHSGLQGHPSLGKLPGIDMTTGSLGQGLSVANGMALAEKLDKKGYYTYVILGDGEIEEGQIWEAAMSASHYKLNKLIVFVDHNGLQIDGKVTEVNSPTPIKEKFDAFGFNTIEIDGHDFEQIQNAVEKAKESTDKPTAIIARTVKGKGVSFMENQVGWHGKAPNEEQYNSALNELNK
ncbi:MAG: transketolase [Clostridiales bacterium]|nr:transketolase [Clostridiales bacterium]